MRQRNFDLLAIAAIFAAYTFTIRLAMDLDLVGCLLGGVANTIPVVIFGGLVRRIVARQLIGKPAMNQLAAHFLLCAAFATLSYGMLIVLLGLFSGLGPEGFVVRPFSASGTAWQTLENVTTYALIATTSYMHTLNQLTLISRQEATADETDAAAMESTAAVAATKAQGNEGSVKAVMSSDSSELEPAARADVGLSRYFVRIGEELRPLDIDTVVSIGGADDYAEVRTLSGKHLVRVTLAEFAKSLDPAKYVRVHRSWIVNTHRIAHAESAGGGRLLLHMGNGPDDFDQSGRSQVAAQPGSLTAHHFRSPGDVFVRRFSSLSLIHTATIASPELPPRSPGQTAVPPNVPEKGFL